MRGEGMKRKRKKIFISTIVSIMGFMLSTSGDVSYAASPSQGVRLMAAAPIATKHGKMISHTNRNTSVTITVGLKLRNRDQLDAFLASLNDPSSSNYKHFLSTKEFQAQFGPADSTVNNVKSFLTSKGLIVKNVSSNNAFITASGTTGQLENAFGVTINNYQNTKGQTYFSNDQAPTIPPELSGIITDVAGLNNEAHFTHPKISKKSATDYTAQSKVLPKLGSGPAGGYTPEELTGGYDVSRLAGDGFTGAGQSVALMELDGYQADNISSYDNYYGLGSPLPTDVYVDGVNGAAGPDEMEVEADIEVVHAIAPQAQVKVYEGPNTDQGVIDTYQKITSDNTAKSISVSWGQSELQVARSTMDSLHTIFQQYAAQGQSIFAASGDYGAYDSGDSTLSVDSPANDPYVTGVGGTSLTLNGTSYSNESAWSDNTNLLGSGGGISTIYTIPSYQTGPGVRNGSYYNGLREIPDVSADADPNTGYSIYSGGSWVELGGTSLASPLWAGIAALNNQYALAYGKGILGQANPILYKEFNSPNPYPAYHDIMSGNNLYYPATAGYDLASGMGTPDAWSLIMDINYPIPYPSFFPVGYIDKPGNGATVTGAIDVNGWFLDAGGVAKIEVLVDGKSMGLAQYDFPRPDVQRAYPDFQNPNSGYHFTLDTTRITNGPHTLTVRETGYTGNIIGKIHELNETVNVQNVQNLPAKGYIETPVMNSTISGTSNVQGWFLDGSGVSKIEVLIDGTLMGTAQYGGTRSDVQKAFPEYQNANSGYQYTLDSTNITNGQHTLTVRETGNNGTTTALSQTVNVQNLPARGYIDSPASNAAISGTSNVQGWFLDGSGVAKIEVLIDGTSVGTAQYGGTRSDVQKAFPQYQNANSGYQYTLDTTKITNGLHTLMIRETGNNGTTTTLSQTENVQNAQSLPAKGYIDTPAINSTISGSSNVQGWFLDGSGVAKIEVLIDGTSVGTAQYGGTRSDVQKAFPQYQNANSGYQYTLDTTKITNGLHTLMIRETGNNGTKTELSQSVNVQNLSARGYIDTPANNSVISGTSNVQGWFLDGSGVAKIELLIDGTLIGTAQYGGIRLDVQKAFPQYQNANSGYQYTLDTTKITNGQHTLTVRETGNNGTLTVLGQKVNVQN
jgi:kumamolisin